MTGRPWQLAAPPPGQALPRPARLYLRTEPCHFTVRGAGVRRPVITTDPALLAWARWNAAARSRAWPR